MKKLAAIYLVFLLTFGVPALMAQSVVCTQSAVITVPVGTTGTLVAAGSQIDVCGFVITGDTNGTRATFNAGTTAKTGAMVINAGIPMVSPAAFGFSAPAGAAVTLTAGTGSITGLIVFRQSQ